MSSPRPSRTSLPHAAVEIDNVAAALVNLSLSGVQIVSGRILRPEERVRVTVLSPVAEPLRLRAVVRWSVLEIPNRRPHYRAGLELLDADQAAIGRFIAAHQSSWPPESPA
jgi:hypothetical protein